jgi:hypothetical protein
VSEYAVAPIFLIRSAGVPFDLLEQLGTTGASAAARELLQHEAELSRRRTAAAALLAQRANGLSPEEFKSLRHALRTGELPRLLGSSAAAYTEFCQAVEAHAAAAARLESQLNTELQTARRALHDSAAEVLPDYLLFGSAGTQDLLSEAAPGAGALPPRNKRARERERHLLLYLQRLAAKNDTFSRFGPSSWGRSDAAIAGIEMSPQPEITARDVFFERWVAHAIAAAMNADADVQSQHGPIEVPALDAHAFEKIADLVERWPNSTARERWRAVLQPLVALLPRFAGTTALDERRAIIGEAEHRLQQIGAAQAASGRALYLAKNPIAEECYRRTDFVINNEMLQQVANDAAPWIELWQDCYSYVASRVAAGLRGIFERVPNAGAGVPLPLFLRACEQAQLPLTGPGLVALAHIGFQEIKAVFRDRFEDRAGLPEWELTAADARFVRETFAFDRFDEYTFPSADLQLSATSLDAVAAGEYQWLLAELHPPVALLHHGGYWSCPAPDVLSEALAAGTRGQPNFHFGFFAADFTGHTAVRMFDALPQQTNFVAPQLPDPRWRRIPPEECEVYLRENSGDVCLRHAQTHEHLGSFARAWLIPLGFHPFSFGRSPHMPRLRCGKVVVQRRSWTVRLEELPLGDYTGVSRDLVVAVEQLRATRDLPRHVYIRPTEQALRRSGAVGRDKDTKPVYIDLESYLSLEIFHRWLVKAGELDVTEMLPDPQHLCWREQDGRRTFELRTLIVPRS